jgi:hypothetical protein
MEVNYYAKRKNTYHTFFQKSMEVIFSPGSQLLYQCQKKKAHTTPHIFFSFREQCVFETNHILEE